MFINLLLAFSNMYAFYCMDTYPSYITMLYITTVISSILMHLSEKKHNLSGISPFSNYSDQFLLLNRIMMITMSLVVCIATIVNIDHLIEVNSNHPELYMAFVILLILALFCYLMAEIICVNTVWYLIFHLSWHVIIYELLNVALGFTINQYKF